MNDIALTPVTDTYGCPFPFFEDDAPPAEGWYKITHDGGHYLATRVAPQKSKHFGGGKVREDIDICFDSLYMAGVRKRLKDTEREKALTGFIAAGMNKLYGNRPDLDEYIADNIKRKRHNLYARKKRFRRKAYLNKWNYFLTFTFDGAKHTPETFRQKLRKCLSNLHTRRGWRYMGVFEYSPEKGRIHFHALAYIPDGQMLGKIEQKESYSPQEGRMKTRRENSFFAEAFGVNDFQEIDNSPRAYRRAVEYILKYVEKQGERIVYSRGICTEICRKLTARDIITDFLHYGVETCLLYDDILDWERDIMHYKPKQMTMADLLCNPPQVA
jgi:hypothetical protein